MKKHLVLSLIISTFVFNFVNINVTANPRGRHGKPTSPPEPFSKPPEDDCNEPLASPLKTPGITG